MHGWGHQLRVIQTETESDWPGDELSWRRAIVMPEWSGQRGSAMIWLLSPPQGARLAGQACWPHGGWKYMQRQLLAQASMSVLALGGWDCPRRHPDALDTANMDLGAAGLKQRRPTLILAEVEGWSGRTKTGLHCPLAKDFLCSPGAGAAASH